MLKQLILYMTLLILAGCGSGGSLTQIVDTKPTIIEQKPIISGYFIDEQVEGLFYNCSSGLSGTTDSNGTFICHENDTVIFKTAGVILGSSTIKDVITPLHLYQESSSTEQAYNIAQLLHSLDSDHNPDNGIQLNTEIFLDGISIDMNSTTFENALASSLASNGMTLYDRNLAITKMLNYITTHDDKTHYGLTINIEDKLQTIESQMCSSSEKLDNGECVAKTCEVDGYDCPVVPTCEESEKLIDNVCVAKTCEADAYNCPVIPTCTESEKLIDNVCVAKTCKADAYNCPVIPTCADNEKLINNICIAKTCEADTYNCPLENNVSHEPFYYQQWYLDKNETFYNQNNIDSEANIHAGELLNHFTGNGIKIAIIDDGLDVTHEDLKDAIIATYNIATKTTDVSHTNHNGHHGTAVTGIIGARVNAKGIAGIASKAQIIFLKYKENMSDSETIELFNKAEEFGADIISNSWGTYDVSEAVRNKIVDLSNNGRDGKGTIIVFACGNDDKDMGNDESAIPEVIAVGATDRENLRAWYSNYGTNLDVVAPGGYTLGVTTLDDMGYNGIASVNDNYLLYNDANSFIGTSASAPIVSGIIALMLEKNPNFTRVEIEKILRNSSDKIGNVPYENGRNDYYGYGKINLSTIIDSI